MSNKRNRRRLGQRIRSEVVRKIGRVTKSLEAFIASQPSERKRKADVLYLRQVYFPTRKQAKARSRVYGNRVISRRLTRSRKNRRKPRVVFGKTWWNHSHDV